MRNEDEATALIAQLAGEVRSRLDGLADAAALIAELLAFAREKRPTLVVDAEVFLPYLAERVPTQGPLERALRSWRTDELLLCCACLEADEQALEIFHREHVPSIRNTLRQLRLNAALCDELQQQLVQELLLPGEGRAALLSNYAGLGSLAGWLRVVTSRRARRALGREKKLIPISDEAIAEQIAVGEGDELAGAKAEYRAAFKRAFKAALLALPPREQNVLRQRYADGLSLEQIGAVYRVHLSTVHRWLERIRAALLEETRLGLARELKISEEECESILRLIQSDLDMTLRTFFGKR